MSLHDVVTPAAVVDRGRAEANAARLLRRAEALGVALRPHLKTAKALEAGRLATGGTARRATVSTLREAEFFFAGGFDDLLYAVSVTPSKVDRVLALRRAGCDLKVVLDDAGVADAVAAAAAAAGLTVGVMIELDCDGHRAGLTPDDPRLVPLARRIHAADGLSLEGVLTHAGESYDSDSTAAVVALAEQERAAAAGVADRLRADGLPCPTVSVGSTPTALFAERLDGVTELRAGVYLFGDLFQHNRGCCGLDEIALSVLCEVIAHKPDRNWLLTDGGALALSKDRGTGAQAAAGRGRDFGFGVVCDLAGAPVDATADDPAGDLRVVSANQEHGIVTTASGRPVDFARFPIGTRLRVLPNHACVTAAGHDGYHVVDGAAGGEELVDWWPRANGW